MSLICTDLQCPIRGITSATCTRCGYGMTHWVNVPAAPAPEPCPECVRLRKRIKEMEREARDAASDAAAEANWKHSQGDDYGSY